MLMRAVKVSLSPIANTIDTLQQNHFLTRQKVQVAKIILPGNFEVPDGSVVHCRWLRSCMKVLSVVLLLGEDLARKIHY